MFNHWATVLRSGLLLQDCGVAKLEFVQKGSNSFEVCARVCFGLQGIDLWRV